MITLEFVEYTNIPERTKEFLKLLFMDLKVKREELLKERESLEKIKKEAHEGILKINADLRKLAALTRHAEEMFAEEKPLV